MKLQLSYLFDTEAELRAHLAGSTREAEDEAEVQAEVNTADVDADGMPYDATVHSSSRDFTAAGLWKAMRGKAEQAEAARAAFKAKGAMTAAPADLPAAAPLGMPLAAAPLGLPVAAVSRAPVSFDTVVAKLSEVMGRGKVTAADLGTLYAEAGASGPEQFETDETARAKLFDLLVARDV